MTSRSRAAAIQNRRGSRLRLALLALTLVFALALILPRGVERYHRWMLGRMPEKHLEGWVEKHPADLDARYQLGMDEVNAGRLREGSALLLQVFTTDPTRTHVLNDYAVALMAQHRNVEALAALTGLLKAEPTYAPAWANLGRLHMLNDMPFTAATELERATKLDNHSVANFDDLGTAYQQSMNYRSALRSFQAARRLDPGDARAGVGEAQAYESLSRVDDASRVIEEVAPHHPADVDVLATLGDIRLERANRPDQIARALPALKRAAELSPDNVPILFNLGVGLRRLGRYPEAIAVFRRALEVSPGYPAALYQLSQALLASGQREEGERLGDQFRIASMRSKMQTGYEGRIAQNPGDEDARYHLAALYLSERRFTDAALQCRALLEARPASRDAKRLLVRVALAAEYSPRSAGS